MILVYCPTGSKSAHDLVGWFANHGVLSLRAHNEKELAQYLQNDPNLVISWGYALPIEPKKSIKRLNAIQRGNKFTQLGRLNLVGVACPRVSLEHERGWLARMNSHQDGSDMVNRTRGDYYTERVNTTHEFRVNVFKGKAFRTGIKLPMTAEERRQHNAPTAHEFIRTKGFGWTWTYSQEALDRTRFDRGPFRHAAEAAVKALGYDFGAVDVGRRSNGEPVVFEVNSAPGLEGSDLSRWGQLFVDYAVKGK